LKPWNHLPSPPASKSITLPTRTFTTPRNPWSFFLNFFWSKICTARMLSSLTRLVSSQHLISLISRLPPCTHISKLSFQYGFSVFLITPVVFVCSPLMVATAKGSGNPVLKRSVSGCLDRLVHERTKDISLVQSIGRNDCELVLAPIVLYMPYDLCSGVLVTLRLGCAGSSMMH